MPARIRVKKSATASPFPLERYWRPEPGEPVPRSVFAWVGRGRASGKLSIEWAMKMAKVSKCTIIKWAKAWAKGATHVVAGGKPMSLDAESDAAIKKAVHLAHVQKPNLTIEQLKPIIQKEMRATATRSGRIGSNIVTPYIVARTIERLKLVTQIGQEKTSARMVAEHDPLTALSTFTLFYTLHRLVSNRYLTANFDASKFFVGGFSDTTGQLTLKLEDDDDTPMTAGEGPGKNVRIGIKYYCIITAAGKAGPIVFHLEDPDEGDEDFQVFEVPGLSITDASDEIGYVVFTKQSCGNAGFFNWFLGDLLAPWLIKQRACRSEDLLAPGVILCDGEDKQILEFANPVLANKLRDDGLMQGKTAASATAVTQACDAYKVFCTIRSLIAGLLQSHEPNPGLEKVLEQSAFAYAGYTHAFWDTGRCKRAVRAIVILHQAIQKTMTRSIILKSWQEVGFIDKNDKFDPVQIFKKFGFKLNVNDLSSLMDDVVKASERFEDKGTLTDDELKKMFSWAKLPMVAGRIVPINTPRSDLTICRQRCVLLLNKEVQAGLTERRKRLMEDEKLRKRARSQAAARKAGKHKKKGVTKTKQAPNGPRLKAGGSAKRGSDTEGDDDDEDDDFDPEDDE